MPKPEISTLPPAELRLVIGLLVMHLTELAEAEAAMEAERSFDALLDLREKARAARDYLAIVRPTRLT